jgi:hypothetical protein
MRLVVESLGRIERAEIELRPLTVFLGENNTNKTWTAHALFKILERLRVYSRQPTRSTEAAGALGGVLSERASAIVQQAAETPGEARLEIARQDLLGPLPAEVEFWVAHPQWMSALGFAPGAHARVTLVLTREELAAGAASSLRLQLALKPFRLATELVVENLAEPLRATNFGSSAQTDAHQEVQQALEDLLLGWKRRVRVLPVEREHLAQIFTWLLARDERVPMPRALVDFCYLLAEARGRAELEPPRGDLGAALHRLLGGRFRFVGVDRELMFEPSEANAQSIPVKASSSLAKSLAGLDLFLWSAGPGDVLLIDEPEMNAHPEAQVALVELFALMIRAGIQIVVVTHSPYLVDHLSTLLELSRLSSEQRAAVAGDLALGNPEAYVRAEELAVWHFGKDGRVSSVLDREAGVIDWSTFTKVSDRESLTINRIVKAAHEGRIARA